MQLMLETAHQIKGPRKVQRKHSSAEAGFADRLNRALDSAGVEGHQKGRGAWLARTLNVSPAAAHKWLSGVTVPERYRVEQLSKELKVSWAWLEMGLSPSQEIDAALLAEIMIGIEEAQETTGKLSPREYAKKVTEIYTICLGKKIPPKEAKNVAMVYAMA